MIAVLLMAYGTPRTRDEIEAYYTDIRRGRPPTPEQLADLAARYNAIGGLSPLAQRTDAQRVALQRALDAHQPARFTVALGLKHAEPKIEVAVEQLAKHDVERIVGLVLAPHYSVLSIGQYLDRMRAAAQAHGIATSAIASWHLDDAYIAFLAGAVRDELAGLPDDTVIVFTAHSLPQRVVADGDPYPAQLSATAAAIAARSGITDGRWRVAWQSAGRTPEPWLGPDILTVIDELAADGHAGILVCACGFVADHLEVLFDLDIEAARRAEKAGIAFARTRCVNDDAAVIDALAGLVITAADAPGDG